MAESIGRIFCEISADTSKLVKGIDDTIKMMSETDAKMTSYGNRLKNQMESMLNPTLKLEKQFLAMGKQGVSSADMIRVFGDKILAAGETARSSGKPVSDFMMQMEKGARSVHETAVSFEALGQSLQNFATNPLMAAR
jgi:hypothetical protein